MLCKTQRSKVGDSYAQYNACSLRSAMQTTAQQSAQQSECCAKLEEVKWAILMHSIMHVHCIVQREQQLNSLNVAHDDVILQHNDKLGVSLMCGAHEHWSVCLTEI